METGAQSVRFGYNIMMNTRGSAETQSVRVHDNIMTVRAVQCQQKIKIKVREIRRARW